MTSETMTLVGNLREDLDDYRDQLGVGYVSRIEKSADALDAAQAENDRLRARVVDLRAGLRSIARSEAADRRARETANDTLQGDARTALVEGRG